MASFNTYLYKLIVRSPLAWLMSRFAVGPGKRGEVLFLFRLSSFSPLAEHSLAALQVFVAWRLLVHIYTS